MVSHKIKILALVFLLGSLISLVSAEYVHLCLGDEEFISINTQTYSSRSPDGDFICGSGRCTAHLNSGSGFIDICVNKISEGIYSPPGLPSRCSGGCVYLNSQTASDFNLSVGFPFKDGGYFTKQSFFMNITTTKIAKISLTDNLNGVERVLCPNCKEYFRSFMFRNGLNDITIKAERTDADSKEFSIQFTIDNRKPMITKTLPLSNKFTNGTFAIEFTEANLNKIVLKYGSNLTGFRSANLSCFSGTKSYCEIRPNLAGMEGQKIDYRFEVSDLAGNLVTSRVVKVNIDSTSPEITRVVDTKSGTSTGINITFVEQNLNKVEYYDNFDSKPMWKIFCSSTKTGSCYKKLPLRIGEHEIEFRVTDKAGNSDVWSSLIVV